MPQVKYLRLAMLVAVLTVVPAAPAWAHADLLRSSPSDKAVLTSGPAEVTLLFNEPVSMALGSVKVLAPDGRRVDAAKASTRDGGRTVDVAVRGELPHGTLTVLWRVLSDDNHTETGAFTFSIEQPSPTAATAATTQQATAGRGSKDLLALSRLTMFTGLVLLVGSGAFLLTLWPRGLAVRASRHLLWTGWVLSVLGSAAGLLLQGPYAAGRSIASALDPALIGSVLHTRYGVAALVRLGLLAATAALLRGLGRDRRPLVTGSATCLSIGVLLSVSAVGHAGTDGLASLALASDAIHLGAVSAWLGGLVLLSTVLLRREPAELAAVLPRWSRYAATAVAVLVVTGAFAAWREVRAVDALFSTAYGRLLLLKTVLVAVTVALGAVGRSWIRRHYVLPIVHAASMTATEIRPAPAPSAVTRLRRSVLLEAGTGAVVLAVAAVLVQTTPARNALASPFISTGRARGAGGECQTRPCTARKQDPAVLLHGRGPKALRGATPASVAKPAT